MMLPRHPITGLCKTADVMAEQEITRDQIEKLTNDAEYLVDEAEALKYVIESVPYDEPPPEGASILNMLKLIDHAQVSYYRPIIEKVFAENRVQKLAWFEHYEETFDPVPKGEGDIQKILNKIVKHRAALLNSLKNISIIDWERVLKDVDGNEKYLIEFANEMIVNERKLLKDIADLVLIYQNEKQHQREINRKASHRNQS
jgi:hypothetical protein